MSHQWYIRVGEKVTKPLAAEEVQRLHRAGKIPANAELSLDGVQWTKLAEFAGASKSILGTSDRACSQAISVRCDCGKRLTAKSEHLGRKARCPSVGAIVTISTSATVDTPAGKTARLANMSIW